MAIQWLRLCTSTEGVTGLIPGQGSSACYALQPRKKTSYRDTLGKYFQNTSDKGPVSMIYKVHSEFNNEETNNLITKWSKDQNTHPTKKIYSWKISICKDAHDISSRKCKCFKTTKK